MKSRIHIIGGPGSGKSYLAKQLSARLTVACHDLDDLFWDNSAESYDTRNSAGCRDALLQDILQEPEWIIEGVYHQWVDASFRDAEAIIVLQSPVWLRDWRIMARFAKRKLGVLKGKRETLRGLIALLRWNHGYNADNLKRALSVLEPYKDKTTECRSVNHALALITRRSQQPAEELQNERTRSF